MVVRRLAVLLLVAGCASSSAALLANGDAGGAPDAGSCQEISARAQAELMDAEAHVADEVACNADPDCVVVSELRFCGGQACAGWLLNEAGATVFRAKMEQINETTCAPFYDAGCFVAIPPCAPPAPGPYCNAGRCSSTKPVDAGADG